jgi:hypothetical protein
VLICCRFEALDIEFKEFLGVIIVLSVVFENDFVGLDTVACWGCLICAWFSTFLNIDRDRE